MKSHVLALAAAAALSTLPAAAATFSYSSVLAPEVPGATGSGTVQVVYDDFTNDLSISTSFGGLSGITTVAHIHCCVPVAGVGTIGVAVTPSTLPGFPVGVSAGSYSATIDLDQASSFTAGFITNFGGGTLAGASAALLAGLNTGTAYFNVHSNTFPGGEIRGFLAPDSVTTPVPEPSTYALMLLGLAAVGAVARRR